MTTSSRFPTISRRSAVGLGVTALGATALASCGTSNSSSFGENASLTIPTHQAPPDVEGAIISDVPGVPMGLTSMPDPLPKSTEGPPGKGGPFTTFQINWGTPPSPYRENEYWQEFNTRLNVDYKPTLNSADAYETSLATMLASGNVPDMVFLQTHSANAQQAIQDGAFAELSEVLGGDKILDYPNLAHVPEHQWRNSAISNGIYGIPSDLGYVNSLHVYRQDWAEQIGFDAPPQDAEEFYELMTEMARLGTDQYGIGGLSDGLGAFVNAMFRVPNTWHEADGELTSFLETDEFEQALLFQRRLWEGGAFHPDALSLSEKGAEDRALFEEGHTGWQVASADNWYLSGALDRLRGRNEGAQPRMLLPFGHDGGEYAFPATPGFFAIIAISAEAAGDEERLHELLSIMNYLRAPIPSEEGFFLRYGLEDVHFRYGESGVPESVPDSPAPADRDAMFYTGLVPVVLYYPDPQNVEDSIDYTEEVTENSIVDPTVGLFAPSSAEVAGLLDDLQTDYVNGLVSGRRPMSDLEKFRTDWRKQGGDSLRDELQEALAQRA